MVFDEKRVKNLEPALKEVLKKFGISDFTILFVADRKSGIGGCVSTLPLLGVKRQLKDAFNNLPEDTSN